MNDSDGVRRRPKRPVISAGSADPGNGRYTILDWDTGFFGVTIARITEPDLSELKLSDLLLELEGKGVKLAYWPSIRELENGIAQRLRGKLVDCKTTFGLEFGSVNFDECICTDAVETYTQSMPITDLENLAVQSGEYSRFAVDQSIPKEKFVDLYHIWIDRSLKKEIAEEVLVIREGERVVGMVTLGNRNGRGDIGLIAVDRNCRGKKYGETLVRAAQRWFAKNGYESGQIVTQGMNAPACALYRKCGYAVEMVEYFYHFWLAPAAKP